MGLVCGKLELGEQLVCVQLGLHMGLVCEQLGHGMELACRLELGGILELVLGDRQVLGGKELGVHMLEHGQVHGLEHEQQHCIFLNCMGCVRLEGQHEVDWKQ